MELDLFALILILMIGIACFAIGYIVGVGVAIDQLYQDHELDNKNEHL